MRPALHGDLVMAACALRAAPLPARADLLARMIAEADAAAAHHARTGRAHPLWGVGSRMARAMARPRGPEPGLGDVDYAACLVLVLEALIARARAGVPGPAGG